MAYTTEAKVKTMFRDIVINPATGNPETETAVTSETVTELITEADAFIDGKLFDYYTTPITGVNSLIMVGRISKLLVAHDIKMILESIDQSSDKKQEIQGNLRAQATSLLSDIMPNWDSDSDQWVEPVVQLVDAPRKAVSSKTGSVFQSNSGTVTITKGGDNW